MIDHTLREPMENLAPCAPLKLGESIVVDGDQGSGRDSKYTLKKISENPDRYEIHLNLEFESKNNLEKTRQCLAENAPYFKGPNGSALILKINEFKDLKTPPPLVRISHSSGTRDYHQEWTADIECLETIHELLHSLGLVDEYKERLLSLKDPEEKGHFQYNCRIQNFSSNGSENNIMSEPSSLDFNNTIIRAHFCACPSAFQVLPNGSAPISHKKNAACLKSIGDQCYNGYLIPWRINTKNPEEPRTEEHFPYYKFLKNPELMIQWALTQNKLSKNNTHGVLLRSIEPYSKVRLDKEKASLLNPMQFDTIVYPGCVPKNKLYYLCAKEAYKTYYPDSGLEQFRVNRCNPEAQAACAPH